MKCHGLSVVTFEMSKILNVHEKPEKLTKSNLVVDDGPGAKRIFRGT